MRPHSVRPYPKKRGNAEIFSCILDAGGCVLYNRKRRVGMKGKSCITVFVLIGALVCSLALAACGEQGSGGTENNGGSGNVPPPITEKTL